MNTATIRSPSYPSMALGDAIEAVAKIEGPYRGSAVDREDAAKLIGYSSLSGPANKALAALASYGLVERAGKGMMRVTSRARAILHSPDDAEKRTHKLEAALEPQLFQDIKERFEDLAIPPEGGVISYLNMEGFNPKAVRPAAKAFLETMEYVQSLGDTESNGNSAQEVRESDSPAKKFGGASLGDFIQWESQGALQFETPRRVRWVSDDGTHLAVEGSDTGIPMSQAILEASPAVVPPPKTPPPADQSTPKEAVKDGQRKAVFPVSEGDVTFIFPEGMTLDGIEELEAYLAVFLKKEKRNAGSELI